MFFHLTWEQFLCTGKGVPSHFLKLFQFWTYNLWSNNFYVTKHLICWSFCSIKLMKTKYIFLLPFFMGPTPACAVLLIFILYMNRLLIQFIIWSHSVQDKTLPVEQLILCVRMCFQYDLIQPLHSWLLSRTRAGIFAHEHATICIVEVLIIFA